MKVDTIKTIDSYLASIKGALINNLTDEEAIRFVEWANCKLSQTIKDRKDRQIAAEIKKLDPVKDKRQISKLKSTRKKYLPTNYPYNIGIGDIVHVNFGFGFCNEISGGHYGIVLSDIVANMYLVLPLSSEELRRYPVGLTDLGLPNAEGIKHGKVSYLRFDQLRYLHYRRLERIKYTQAGVVKLSSDQLDIVYNHLKKFLDFPIDKE